MCQLQFEIHPSTRRTHCFCFEATGTWVKGSSSAVQQQVLRTHDYSTYVHLDLPQCSPQRASRREARHIHLYAYHACVLSLRKTGNGMKVHAERVDMIISSVMVLQKTKLCAGGCLKNDWFCEKAESRWQFIFMHSESRPSRSFYTFDQFSLFLCNIVHRSMNIRQNCPFQLTILDMCQKPGHYFYLYSLSYFPFGSGQLVSLPISRSADHCCHCKHIISVNVSIISNHYNQLFSHTFCLMLFERDLLHSRADR